VQLAALGIPVLTLIDDDVVSIENLAVQGYTPSDLQRPKVDACAEVCQAMNPQINLQTLPVRFTRSSILSSQRDRMAIFACVDSMMSRRILFQQTHAKAGFYADGRMAGEVLRVIASNDPPADSYYPQTLFEDRQAHPAPCTSRSTLYAASIAAGLMLSRFAAHLRGQVFSRDVLLNLTADELVILG